MDLETTKAEVRGMEGPLLWRRWAKGGDSEVRMVGSWRGVVGRWWRLRDGIMMYAPGIAPRDFTGLNPSTYPEIPKGSKKSQILILEEDEREREREREREKSGHMACNVIEALS